MNKSKTDRFVHQGSELPCEKSELESCACSHISVEIVLPTLLSYETRDGSCNVGLFLSKTGVWCFKPPPPPWAPTQRQWPGFPALPPVAAASEWMLNTGVGALKC